MFNGINTAHLKIGLKKEKAMEAELKNRFCNITREIIKINLDSCESCTLMKKKREKRSVTVANGYVALNPCCQVCFLLKSIIKKILKKLRKTVEDINFSFGS